jgi:hypothetical protein
MRKGNVAKEEKGKKSANKKQQSGETFNKDSILTQYRYR